MDLDFDENHSEMPLLGLKMQKDFICDLILVYFFLFTVMSEKNQCL